MLTTQHDPLYELHRVGEIGERTRALIVVFEVEVTHVELLVISHYNSS